MPAPRVRTRAQLAGSRKIAAGVYPPPHTPKVSLRNPANSPGVCCGRRGPTPRSGGCVARFARKGRVCDARPWFNRTCSQVSGSDHGPSSPVSGTHPRVLAAGAPPAQHTSPEFAGPRKVGAGVCGPVAAPGTHPRPVREIPQGRRGCVPEVPLMPGAQPRVSAPAPLSPTPHPHATIRALPRQRQLVHGVTGLAPIQRLKRVSQGARAHLGVRVGRVVRAMRGHYAVV